MADKEDGQEPTKPMFDSMEAATEAYKRLQTQLNKAQGVARETMISRFVVDDLVGRVDELTETVKAAGSRDYGNDDEDNPFKALGENKAARGVATGARATISNLLMEAGEDFNDPKFATAADHYSKGMWSDAIEATKTALGVDETGDSSAAIDAAVAAALRSRGLVDDGKTSNNGSTIPSDPEALKMKLRDKSWVRANRAELLAAARAGQVS